MTSKNSTLKPSSTTSALAANPAHVCEVNPGEPAMLRRNTIQQRARTVSTERATHSV
jgi:hypothetical protein